MRSKAQKRVLKYGGLIRRLRGIQANCNSLTLTEYDEFTDTEIKAKLLGISMKIKGIEDKIVDKWHGRN